MDSIKYRSGYKYQLAEDYTIRVELIGYSIDTQFIKLTPIGVLLIRSGYAWDGPSGPAIDSMSAMRGSLVHDAIYQLMRMALLPIGERGYSDQLLEDICLEDGMNPVRAEIWRKGVSLFAESAASPENVKEVFEAPIKR